MFPRAIRTLDRAQPVFEYARGYTPDFAAWITNFGQVAANYDANGHYARVQPMFLPAQLAAARSRRCAPQQKLNGFERGILSRCPGGVIQPPPDGSARSPAEGCDPATTPPGP